MLLVWAVSNWAWGLLGASIVAAVFGVLGAVVGFANAYLFVAALLLAFAAFPKIARPAWEAIRRRELVVRIEEDRWDPFEYEAFILEIKVRIRNRTKKTKTLRAFGLQVAGRPSTPSFPTIDAYREVEARRARLPRLDHHSIIEPKSKVSGWLVYALPWTNDPGPTAYTLIVEDELNYRYEARPS